MNTTELTSVEINRLVANAAGWFVDDEGDLCYLYTQEQRDAATTAEERLVNLVDGGAMDIASIDVRAIKSALGVNRVPADFERTVGRKLDSIQEQAEELAAKSVVEVALSSTCRYCGTTVTWSGEANMPTDGNGMICCDGCYNEATGYGEFAEEGR